MPTLRQKAMSLLLRRYPFYSGCGTLANHPFVQSIAGKSEERIWTRVPGGEVLAPLDDHVGRSAYYAGDLDRKVTWICSKLVKNGDTVLDVGANLGLVTMWLSFLAGSKGAVHAFEPNFDRQDILEQVIKRNCLSNVCLHPIGLGERESVHILRVPARNMGMGTLNWNKDLGIDQIREYRVRVRPLSRILEQESITKIRLMKLDVEGFELNVLKGAETYLRNHQIDAILFELNDPSNSFYQEEIIKYLDSLDYGFFSTPKCLVKMGLK